MNLKHLKKFNESWEAENQKIIDEKFKDEDIVLSKLKNLS